MAKVYLAVAEEPAPAHREASPEEPRLVVLKAMQEDLALDPDLVAMFLEEARLGARLRHPNVVQTLEVAELLGRPMIVMEYLEGESLSRVLYAQEGREITRAMKLEIVAAALEGLEYIHERTDEAGAPIGLVHRDVSPHNLFVTFDGRVKVLDFGIAKGLGSNGQARDGGLKGKIRYMAPEQMEGAAVDRRADVFSVGVILWEIATGQRLWQSRSEVNVMRAVLTEGVPPPRSASPSIPSELDDLCVKALARSPEGRYQTAAELRAAILRFLEREGERMALADVGEVVARAFAEKRERTREVITQQLAREDTPHLGRERFGLPVHLPSLATATTSRSAGGAEVAAPPSSRPRSWTLVAFLAAATAGMALLGVGSRGGVPDGPPGAIPATRQRAESAPPPSLPEGGTEAASPHRTVHVHLAATPATAVLYLDGTRLPANPFEADYPSDPVGHTVRAEAPGFVSSAAGIVLEDDVKLVLPLSPAKIAAIPRHARADELPSRGAPPPVVSSPAPAPPAPSPNPDCSPPFYFDAQGIKRLKPDCI
jgi:serine/threonine-protein kinase